MKRLPIISALAAACAATPAASPSLPEPAPAPSVLAPLPARARPDTAAAQDGLQAETAQVEVEGWGNVEADDLAQARASAIRDAQRQAIEQTAGVHIKSFMSDQARSELRGNAERFSQDVHAKLETSTDGFVESTEILSERRDQQTYKVRARVHVQNRALLREIAVLAGRIRWARFPKLVFLVKEEYTSRDGATAGVPEPEFQHLLENEFLALGFDVVDQATVRRLRSEEAQVFDDIVNDDNKAAQFAMQRGAEYVVTGVARVRFVSFDEAGLGWLGHAELSVRAIEASTGQVVESRSTTGSGPASPVSEVDMRIRTTKSAGAKAARLLLAGVTRHWDVIMREGARYSLKFYGVGSWADEVAPILDYLQKIPGILSVTERQFAGERLEVDVRYTGARSSTDLAREILGLRADARFRELDRDYSPGGRDMNFRVRKAKR